MDTKINITIILLALFLITSLITNTSLGLVFAEGNLTLNTYTDIKNSVPHNAVNHESHQVVHFIEPRDNVLYSGMITFTSSIPVDIISLHDITNIAKKNITGIKTWIVDGKELVPTTLMKNVTSGTVDFVGSGILSHIPYNQTYNMVFSIEANSFKKEIK